MSREEEVRRIAFQIYKVKRDVLGIDSTPEQNWTEAEEQYEHRKQTQDAYSVL